MPSARGLHIPAALLAPPVRQDYLETALDWISGGDIEGYMAAHQHDQNAGPLWRYFQGVIEWVKTTLTTQRKKYMKGVDWGHLYNQYKDTVFDTAHLGRETARLIADDDVQRKMRYLQLPAHQRRAPP